MNAPTCPRCGSDDKRVFGPHCTPYSYTPDDWHREPADPGWRTEMLGDDAASPESLDQELANSAKLFNPLDRTGEL